MANNPPQKTDPRPYAAAHFALELDGKQDVGLFRSIEGGGVRADVMTYQHGVTYERWRQLGKPKYEDLKLQVGMSMSWGFMKWLQEFFTGAGTRKNGAILAADFYYKERARRTFTEGLLKEVTIPKFDAADKNPAYLSVGMAVESIVFAKGSGEALDTKGPINLQRAWKACNFHMTLDGFGDACDHISKVDSFTIKQTVMEYHSGTQLAPIKAPSQIDFPNVTFYIPEAFAAPFEEACIKHFRAGVGGLRPDSGQEATKGNGSLAILDNTLEEALGTIEFFGVDIVSVTPDRLDASSEEIKLVKVEMYVEKMTFSFPFDNLE